MSRQGSGRTAALRGTGRWVASMAVALGLGLAAGTATALTGAQPDTTGLYGAVGTFTHGARTYNATQISAHWAVSAAHVTPSAGTVFANDYGQSTIVATYSPFTVTPDAAPFTGALRDDLVLLRLADAIAAPGLPTLSDLPLTDAPSSPFATLASNNPSLGSRAYGVDTIADIVTAAGYGYYVAGGPVSVVDGDSGSALFAGEAGGSGAGSVLLGVGSLRAVTDTGTVYSVYTALAPYRGFIDARLALTGDQATWLLTPVPEPGIGAQLAGGLAALLVVLAVRARVAPAACRRVTTA